MQQQEGITVTLPESAFSQFQWDCGKGDKVVKSSISLLLHDIHTIEEKGSMAKVTARVAVYIIWE